jgi:hypothetical protein
MFKLQKTITILIFPLAPFPIQLIAVDFTWTEGHYDLPLPDYSSINILNIQNDVTVTMNGGGVHQFNMYDNSELTTYGGGGDYLNLYDNAKASFFYLIYMNELYIDPASAVQVKLYATFVNFENLGLEGENTLYVRWLSNDYPFQCNLVGEGALDHVQFVPEPASAVLFGLGYLLICSRRRRKLTA